MKYIGCFVVMIQSFFLSTAQDTFQLAAPFIQHQSVFFKRETRVEIAFGQKGTAIHYTVNGEAPASTDEVYTKPLIIKKNFTTLKARVFGKGFLASETEQAIFIKEGIPVKSIEHPVPHEKYSGEGDHILSDNKGGIPSFQSKTWLGFLMDTVTFTLAVHKKQPVQSVLFQLLQDYNSWIFFPDKAEVYCNMDGVMQKQGEMFFSRVAHKETKVIQPFVIPFSKKARTDLVQLKIYTCSKIPDWHPGKGQMGWLFIDEIKIY